MALFTLVGIRVKKLGSIFELVMWPQVIKNKNIDIKILRILEHWPQRLQISFPN
jgi:hypothetical protein